MMEQFVLKVLNRFIKEKKPHLQRPSLVKAKVMKVEELSEGYRYNLKILDESGITDDEYPEIPKVNSDRFYENGSVVVVGFLYGTLELYIVGK